MSSRLFKLRLATTSFEKNALAVSRQIAATVTGSNFGKPALSNSKKAVSFSSERAMNVRQQSIFLAPRESQVKPSPNSIRLF
jgi:hypothetical protein